MIIGITGGVGCGKSTVLEFLKDNFNAYVIDADKVAHSLMEPGMQAYDSVKAYFGDEIILSDGFIDRKRLGQLVFSDKKKLKALNDIVHPQVKEAIKALIKAFSEKSPQGLIAVEAALFIEAGYVDICDELWYIYTENKIRIERLMQTRGYTEEKARSIIANQLSDEEFRRHCDVVIDNSRGKKNTHEQIRRHILNKQSESEKR